MALNHKLMIQKLKKDLLYSNLKSKFIFHCLNNHVNKFNPLHFTISQQKVAGEKVKTTK